MEFEALFLGLEPLTALTVGIAALALAPVVNTVGKAMGHENLGEPLAELAKEHTKKAMVWSLDAIENSQSAFAEVEESFRDLVADAQAERIAKKAESNHTESREVEIVSE
jgi:hypothetical protein